MKKSAAAVTRGDRGDEIDVFQSITNHIMKKKRVVIKVPTFVVDSVKYEIQLDRFNEEIDKPVFAQEFRTKISEYSPLLIDGGCNTAEDGIYTWVFGSIIKSRGRIEEHLWAKKVISGQEIGTTHLAIIDSINPDIVSSIITMVDEPDVYLPETIKEQIDNAFKLYFSGEFKIEGDTITFNFASGTFMLNKFMATTRVPEYSQFMVHMFSQYFKSVVAGDVMRTFISSSQSNVPSNILDILDNLHIPYQEIAVKTKSKKSGKVTGGANMAKILLFMELAGLTSIISMEKKTYSKKSKKQTLQNKTIRNKTYSKKSKKQTLRNKKRGFN
jgi:hypothetical protein